MRRIAALFAVLCLSHTVLAAPPEPKTRVVLVSLDGWHAALAAEMPVVRTLMREGSWTLRAETPLPSITTVSHAAIFTGALPKKNGVTTHEPPETEMAAEKWRPLLIDTIFEVVKARGAFTAALVEKQKFQGLVPWEALAVRGMFPAASKTPELEYRACQTFDEMPAGALLFIHLRELDDAGHAYGWLSKRQHAAAAHLNAALGRLATCMHESERKTGVPITLIVTTDHGGHGRTHGSAAPSDHLVPWIALGPGIRKDHEIRQSVRLIDTAPTILHALGLPVMEFLPSADGKVVGEIFITP